MPEGKVFIALCTRSPVHPLTAGELLLMEKPGFTWHWNQEMPLDVARNKAVLQFLMLGEDYTHLLFLDHDIVPKNDSLKLLWEANKEVVTGLYYRRLWPFMPQTYLFNKMGGWDFVVDLPKNTLVEIDGAGLGWILIRRDVFQTIKPPWFEFSRPLWKQAQGEDYYFFTKLRKKGMKAYVHTGCTLGHVAMDETIEERHYLAARNLLERRVPIT